MKMKKEGRKGQAALEYLTTYGWAFMVILIGVAALYYFGFINPSQYVPDRCWFGAQLVCEDYRILAGNPADLDWKVRNNFGKAIVIEEVQGVDSDYPLSSCNTDLTIGVGEIIEIQCEVDAQIFSGDKYSIPAEITFRRDGDPDAPQHKVSGEIYTTAQ